MSKYRRFWRRKFCWLRRSHRPLLMQAPAGIGLDDPTTKKGMIMQVCKCGRTFAVGQQKSSLGKMKRFKK